MSKKGKTLVLLPSAFKSNSLNEKRKEKVKMKNIKEVAKEFWLDYIKKSFPESMDLKSIVKMRVVAKDVVLLLTLYLNPNKSSIIVSTNRFVLVSRSGIIREMGLFYKTKKDGLTIEDFRAHSNNDEITIEPLTKDKEENEKLAFTTYIRNRKEFIIK